MIIKLKGNPNFALIPSTIFMFVEDWTFFEAFYYCVITLGSEQETHFYNKKTINGVDVQNHNANGVNPSAAVATLLLKSSKTFTKLLSPSKITEKSL